MSEQENRLSHFDAEGKAVMVDVSGKAETRRVAVARGYISMSGAAFAAVQSGTAEKGDVLGVARVAGIMAAKGTAGLIPMCHPLMIEKAAVDFTLYPGENRVEARCTVQTSGKTGVEMEALCGASVALLTVYDMCKALDRGMVISEICLLEKDGGRSGHYVREAPSRRGRDAASPSASATPRARAAAGSAVSPAAKPASRHNEAPHD